jgi:hypothetical protein
MTTGFERDLGRIEGKLDQIIETQQGFVQRHERLDEKITDKHEKLSTRIGAVENKIHWYTGGMAAISAAFVFMGDQIRRIVFGH